MSPYVSLTRSGLPRIIPSFHRRLIKDGVRPRSDNLVKMYLSWFTVARLARTYYWPKMEDDVEAYVIACFVNKTEWLKEVERGVY
jgi:hypothetical protein